MTRATRVARTATTALALAGTAWYALAYLYVALRRFTFPYELEWLEGGVLDEVRAVTTGKQLYTAPTLRSVPYIYTPLYVWVTAAVSKVVGLGFPALRAVSIVASVVAAVAIFRLVHRDGNDAVAGALAIGIFLATFEISGSWLDLARVDTLFLALLLWGLVLARDARTPARAAASAVVLVAAIFTKQSALLPALAVVPFLFTYGKRVALTFAATFGGVLLAAVGVMQLSTDGWFLFYVRTVPAGHAIAQQYAGEFWTDDLLGNVWPAMVLTIAAIATLIARRRASIAPLWFHVPVLAGMLASAYSARLHTGGYANVLLPAYAALAVTAGLGVAAARRARRPAWAVAATALVVVQLAILVWSPGGQLPRRGDVAAGRRLVEKLRALPGPVYLPGQPYLLTRSGRAADAGAQSAAIEDVLRAHTGANSDRLAAELESAIRTQRFCTVVVDRPIELSYLPADFATYYEPGQVLLSGRELEPVTGTIAVPWQAYTPIGAAAAARCQRT